jgi:hypothetical protein
MPPVDEFRKLTIDFLINDYRLGSIGNRKASFTIS